MLKKMIPGKNGYDIPCLMNIEEGNKRVVVVCHGFGGSKDSKTVGVFESLPVEYGLGVICFDFPAHGESRASIDKFSVANCVADLSAVVSYVREFSQNAEIVFFSTSFGAFITILYLAERKQPRAKAFLRSAAFRMPQIVKFKFLPEEALPDSEGMVELRVPVAGTVKVPLAFIKELQDYDLYSLCSKATADFFMIHGADDDISPLNDAREFAVLTGAKLKTVTGANHFEYPGGISPAVKEAVNFYRAGLIKSLSIREINEADVSDAVERIWGIFMENEASGCSIEAAIGLKKLLDKKYKRCEVRAIGAFENDKLFGGVLLKKDMSKLFLIEIDKQHQGCGVVQMLFDAVLKSCTCESISAFVPSFAANMYRDLGFAASSEPVNARGLTLVLMKYQLGSKRGQLRTDAEI